MVAPRALWLAHPSRYAALPPVRARWFLGALALLLLASLTMPGPASVDAPAQQAEAHTGAILSEAIVEGVRHGGDYYGVAADALHASGDIARPFVAIPLPTLAVVQARLSPVVAALTLYALAVGSLFAWYARLIGVFRYTRLHLIAVALAAGGMTAAMRADLVTSNAVWAGLLIALSLAAWRPGQWQSAVALGLAAMLIDETAALFVALMAALALWEGRPREALGWVAATGIFALALLLHMQAVAEVVGPIEPTQTGMIDMGFVAIRELASTNMLSLAPPAMAAALLVLALFGWSAWRDPLALRALVMLGVCLVLMALAGTFGPAFLVAPLVSLGLVFAVDGVRDLTRAALDTRRITVTRTAR